MSNPLTPRWIAERKKLLNENNLQRECDSLRAALASKTILSDGPAFWKALLTEIQATLPHLREFAASGAISPTHPQSGEGYLISVSRQSAFPVNTDVTIYFDGPGSREIRCHPMHGEAYKLSFGLGSDRQLGVYGSDTKPMSPADACTYIVKPLVATLDHITYRVG